MAFDECTDYPSSYEDAEQSMHLTHRWTERSLNYFQEHQKGHLLFGIVQGGLNLDLRAESAESMINLNFDGYAIGGLAIGETQLERKSVVDFLTEVLPIDKPRYVMGLGDTVGLIDLIDSGVDMFDCVWPARLARHGKLIIKNKYICLLYTSPSPRD